MNDKLLADARAHGFLLYRGRDNSVLWAWRQECHKRGEPLVVVHEHRGRGRLIINPFLRSMPRPIVVRLWPLFREAVFCEGVRYFEFGKGFCKINLPIIKAVVLASRAARIIRDTSLTGDGDASLTGDDPGVPRCQLVVAYFPRWAEAKRREKWRVVIDTVEKKHQKTEGLLIIDAR